MTNDANSLPAWVDPDDAPELTDELLDQGEVFRGEHFVRRARGRPSTGNAKEHVSVRLDRDVVAKLREAGPGWQSQVNVLLRGALGLGERGKEALAAPAGAATSDAVTMASAILKRAHGTVKEARVVEVISVRAPEHSEQGENHAAPP